MVATTLVNKQVDEGKKLILLLDDAGVRISIAFWAITEEAEEWRLILGKAGVSQTGTRTTYELIYSLIRQNNIQLSLNDISLVDSNGELCTLLKSAVQTETDLAEMPFTGNYINGQRFPNSIIYRVHSH